VKGAQRGQALIETVVFLPIMLLLLFSIIYLSQAGVAQERGQTAVRYGSLVSPVQNYSIAAMYQAYNSGLPSPIPFTSPAACSGTSAGDTQAAVNQAQVLPTTAPTSYPTTQPLWRVPSPSAACVIGERQISQGFYPGLTVGYVELMTDSVTATAAVPGYLQRAIPNAIAVNAKMTVYLPLTVNDLLYCTNGMEGSVVQGSGSQGPAYAPVGAAIPNPIASELDPKETLFPAYWAHAIAPQPAWTASNGSQSFNYDAQAGMGSGPLGCENY
jgi:hypothetical protein